MGNPFSAPAEVPSQIDGYTLEEKLGEGAFGQVWKASKRGRIVAIKCIQKSGDLPGKIEKEVAALKRCKHTNIVDYIKLLSDEKFEYIVMEFCPGGSFRSYLKENERLSEARTKGVFKQLAAALNYMNQKQIIHRDLKPDNILIVDKTKLTIKVADFGIAKLVFMEFGTDKAIDMLRQSCAKIYGTECGTMVYIAPEVLTGKYTAKVDLWSAGVILYECLLGTYKMFDMVDELHQNRKNIAEHNIGGGLSATCKDMLKKLLVYDQDNRIGYSDFMRHPFIA